MSQPQAPYTVPGQPTPEQIKALNCIRLVIIEDLIEAAQEQGQARVSLDVTDARWLVEQCYKLFKEER